MKKNLRTNVLGVITLIVAVFFFFSCKPGDTPGDPTDPDDPTPTALVPPVVTIGSAENVTDKSAILIGWVKSNEKDTKVYFEYKLSTESSFHQMPISGSYTDTISMKITLDLTKLTPNAEYSFKLTAFNAAGKKSSEESKFSTYVVRDYDGNLYHVIKIGNQYWLQENLKTSHYSDGTAIPNVTDGEAWAGLNTPGYCWYNNDKATNEVYGALYNSYTTQKNLIAGYHVPSVAEFETLQSYLGGSAEAAIKMMDASGKYWATSLQPTNSSGFTALGSGNKGSDRNSSFRSIKMRASFLTNTLNNFLIFYDATTEIAGASQGTGSSIRLIKD